MGILNWFVPKQRDFFKMLREQAAKTLEGMQALNEYVKAMKPEDAARVKRLEEEADDLRAALVCEINDTFITPIDREDICTLSRALDDILDYGKKTVIELEAYKITTTDQMKEMIEVLMGGTEQLKYAIDNLDKNPQVAGTRAASAKKAENKIEYIYHRALTSLFETTDTIYILKCREIYRHISNAADQLDQAANILQDITVKII